MHTDEELVALADSLASKPRSWLEDRLVSAKLLSYDDLRGPHSVYAPILAKREFAKAVLFDLRAHGGLETLLAELASEHSQSGNEGIDQLERVPQPTVQRAASGQGSTTAAAKSPAPRARLKLPHLPWGCILAPAGILLAVFVIFYGDNLCSQEAPPSWTTPLLKMACPDSPRSRASTPKSQHPTLPAAVATDQVKVTETPHVALTPEATVCEGMKLEISELMLVPQPPGGDPDLGELNEYVEIHNYGEMSIDVGGLWIADTGGHPGSIVSWSDVFGGIPVGDSVTDSTDIPPGGYGVVLPRAYERGDQPYSQELPEGARILTLRETETIGNGLVATLGHTLDVVVLYLGTEHDVLCFVSTYGSPTLLPEGSPPSMISDDGLDSLPIGIREGGGWGGFSREYPSGADSASNWNRFLWSQRSPGQPPKADTQG